MTPREIIQRTEKLFSQAGLYYGHGTDNAANEAFYLVMKAANLEFDCAESELDKSVPQATLQNIELLVSKRIEQRIPVAYLVNEAWFAGYPFYVDERVLIPRSPIAELITAQFTPWVKPELIKSILDVGTGSGCIAIASAYFFPDAQVDAIDIDPNAIEVAIKNVNTHQLNNRVNIIKSDLYENIGDKKYDIIISNPPYVGKTEMDNLPAEYKHEPGHALEAEDNGLEIVKKILQQSANYLNENGVLFVEVGNSMVAVDETLPHVPVTWLEFENGGEGVFFLRKEELERYCINIK